ncbi:MAG: hypothetical protein VX815_10360 [Gemmatimonadota bacterium]|nr:hypothetical protein [Gemmatimonadota bacterium]
MHFGVQVLDRIHHGAYSNWVKAGISAAAGGYALVTALGVFILQAGLLNGGMAISSIMVLPTVIVGAGTCVRLRWPVHSGA